MHDTKLAVDQILTQLTNQPKALAALTAGLPRARLGRSSRRDEWSPSDVLAHVRSCDDVWGRYIAMIISEDHPTIRAMSPRTWIKSTNYPDLDFTLSLRAFTKQRGELLGLLRRSPIAAWARSATVTGAGRPREWTVRDYAQRLAEHERSHVEQIARIVA